MCHFFASQCIPIASLTLRVICQPDVILCDEQLEAELAKSGEKSGEPPPKPGVAISQPQVTKNLKVKYSTCVFMVPTTLKTMIAAQLQSFALTKISDVIRVMNMENSRSYLVLNNSDSCM